MTKPAVTLQIGLAPSDWRLAQHILPHQIRAWGNQVSEILITVDLHRSSGRFAADWEKGRDRILELAQSVKGARVETVDYSEQAKRGASDEFFGGRAVPAKDFRGGPYYSYFFGLWAASNRIVFHTDSDILYGGGSQSWIEEACAYSALHPEVLFSAPLPGPPAADNRLKYLRAVPDTDAPHAHRFESMSTRLYMVDRDRFRDSVGRLEPLPPTALRNRIKARVEGNPAADLPEHLFSREMIVRSLVRRDFLGTGKGMWSLHPPYRCADFFEKLPSLVRLVESGNIPEEQRGDHDINSSLVDWSEATDALARNRWWKRMLRRI